MYVVYIKCGGRRSRKLGMLNKLNQLNANFKLNFIYHIIIMRLPNSFSKTILSHFSLRIPESHTTVFFLYPSIHKLRIIFYKQMCQRVIFVFELQINFSSDLNHCLYPSSIILLQFYFFFIIFFSHYLSTKTIMLCS